MEKEFTLPDGNIITVGEERFTAPEILFQPMLCGKEAGGVAEITFDCIMKCEVDLRKTLFENVILSGGTTMYQGFRERLLSELKKKAPVKVNVKVWAPDNDAMLCGTVHP